MSVFIHHPESNGSAEAGVKHLKGILRKRDPKSQLELSKACFDFNAMDRAGKVGSPHQLFFQCEPGSRLPSRKTLQLDVEKCKWNREGLAEKSWSARLDSPKLAKHEVGDEVRTYD